jgi:spore germination protein KC
MKRKTGIITMIIYVLAQSILCTGCWSSKEVESLALVTVMGMDYRNENGRDIWKASALVLLPQRGGQGMEGGQEGQSRQELYFEGEGPTPQSAILDFSMQMSRTPFYGYISGYIFGESVGKGKMIHFVESSARYWQTRPRNVYVLAKGEASEVLKAGGSLDKQLSKELTEFTDYRATATGQSVGVYRYQFEQCWKVPTAMRYWSHTNASDYLHIMVREQNQKNNATGGSQDVIPAARSRQYKKGNVMEGVGVFRCDKLAGYLNREETEGYIMLTHKITKGQMTIAVEP